MLMPNDRRRIVPKEFNGLTRSKMFSGL